MRTLRIDSHTMFIHDYRKHIYDLLESEWEALLVESQELVGTVISECLGMESGVFGC